MVIFTLTIAGGNPTALVYGNPDKSLAKALLKKVEQVGFISKNKLTMMGEELCINAILAFGSILKRKGKFSTSGIKELVKYFNKSGRTTIQLPLRYMREKILFYLKV